MAVMSRWVLAFLAFLACLACVPIAARAEQRVALVVGNSNYRHAGELRNPANDAADVAAALRKLGFEVIEGRELDKQGLEGKVRQFAQALKGADAAVFFYAGHGLQVGGQNFLVPVDAKLEDASGLDLETTRLDLVQRVMEREAKTSILFLDACRNNPLMRNLARAMGSRSTEVGRGLAPTESGIGTLISFSTQPGNVASDGAGRNSPFAGALVKELATSSEDLGAMLIAVRNEVMRLSNNQQVPWEHSALRARFYFADQAAVAPGQAAQSEVSQRWAEIKDETDAALLEAFRAQYGPRNPLYDRMAQKRLEALNARSGAANPHPPILAAQATTIFRNVFDKVRQFYPEKVDEPALLSRGVARIVDRYPDTLDRRAIDAKIAALDQGQANAVPELLAEIFAGVQQQYARTAEPEVLLETTLNVVLRGLDSQSYYLRPERQRSSQAQIKGEFGGIGVEIRIENGLTKVLAPLDDTPASKVDLRTGDIITHIDGKPTAGLTLAQVVGRLRGPVKTPVTVSVQRKGVERLLELNMTRDVVRISAVKSRLESDVVYVKVTTFNEQARPNLKRAIEELKKAAGVRLKGYILDLRNNSGGLLDVATAIADDFLDSGIVVKSRGRTDQDAKPRLAQPGDILDGKPMIVLVNGGTASGAEIVAAALQENKRAVLIGTRTFGKGTVQTIYPFGNQGALRLTTAHFYTPLERELETVGVSPDIVLELETAGAGRDAPLEAALARLRAGRVR
jgi:carboxyl-terminal processing protease